MIPTDIWHNRQAWQAKQILAWVSRCVVVIIIIPGNFIVKSYFSRNTNLRNLHHRCIQYIWASQIEISFCDKDCSVSTKWWRTSHKLWYHWLYHFVYTSLISWIVAKCSLVSSVDITTSTIHMNTIIVTHHLNKKSHWANPHPQPSFMYCLAIFCFTT